jgi:methylmalonyl-CoA/ethylmalonyl-CoA epimerase
MRLKRIDHIGVAVEDLDAARTLFASSFELEANETMDLPGIHAEFFACGDTRIELIDPSDPDLRQLRLRGERARIDHLAFEVEDLDETLRVLEGLGIEMQAPPRVDSVFRTSFTLPASSGGLRLQFSERL